MTRKWKWVFGILIVFVVLLIVDFYRQKEYTSSSMVLISDVSQEIAMLSIVKGKDTLTLALSDTVWTLQEHDSLEVRQMRVKSLLDKLVSLSLGSVLSNKRDKWGIYSVDDSTGVLLTLFDFAGDTLDRFVLGRSKSDWSRNNIRISSDANVYQLNGNILSLLQMSPTYWGEKPKPSESTEQDSLKVETTL